MRDCRNKPLGNRSTRLRAVGAGMMEYMLIMLLVAFGAITAVRHLGQVAQQQTATMAQELAGVDTGTNGGTGNGGVDAGGNLPGSDFNDGGGDTGGGASGSGGDGGSGGSGSGGNGGTGSGGGSGGAPTDGGGGDTPPGGSGGSSDGMPQDDLLACLKKKVESENEDNDIDVKEKAYEGFRKYEGDIPKMYLDTGNNVTVGIGNMLPDKESAKNLDFYIKVKDKETGKMVERLATDAEIADAWDSLSMLTQPDSCTDPDDGEDPSGCYTAGTYEKIESNNVYLHENDRISAAKEEIKDFGAQLKDGYPDFDTYPDKVKLALYDMVFNLGIGNLVDEFVKFTTAIKERDWKEAASESKRTGIQDDRNKYVKDLLEDAASDKKQRALSCKSSAGGTK